MKRIPSGTVTFLFSDIEGSTGLWERFPEQMKAAFQRQESIFREGVAQHGGYVYKMEGDAFQVAFETAPAAICAALEVQQRLHAEAWGEAPIRVRMALHTGVTEERGDDYVGPALNRLGRLLNAAYGGQVLLTQATAELVQDDLPCGASLRNLGEHRFRDLVRPEHIYQLEAAGLPSGFPPLKTLDAFPHNLPIQLTSFIGRESEMMNIKLLLTLDRARLVTLTGAGGTGKTRLALQVAADLLEIYKDGVWLVELAPLADPALVPQTVAAVLGVRETPGKAIIALLTEYLRSRRLLLILDNCEHVVEASASLAESLLQSCPDLQILATSREILGMAGEAPFLVPSLSVPDVRHMPPLEQLTGYESVRLFLERATQISPDFILGAAANAPTIARICARLDGIPLAIELAAARIRMLSVDQIAARLDDAYRLLTGGSRSVLPRHQTLKALFDWSYTLLTPAERTLFLNLSAFAGGWTLEAAEDVCGGQEPAEVFSLLAQLVDKSLVLAVQEGSADTRYRLLETIRQYAREKMNETGDWGSVRDRHLDYYLGLARLAEPHLRSKDQAAWLDRLEIELDNLRLALEWSQGSRVPDGLRLATALFWFWHIHGHGSEGIDWLERLLAAERQGRETQTTAPCSPLERAKALVAVSFLLAMQQGPEKSRSYLLESLEICRSLGEGGRQVLAHTLVRLGEVTEDEGQQEALYQEALAISRQQGDLFNIAECLQDLGGLWMSQGKFPQAEEALAENLTLRKELHDLDGMGTVLMEMGSIAFNQDKPAEAEAHFIAARECYEKVGNKRFVSQALYIQAMVAFAEGDFSKATQLSEQAVAIGQELGESTIIALGLVRLGRASSSIGNFDLARSQFEEVLKVSRETGIKQLQAVAHDSLGALAYFQAKYSEAYDHLKQSILLWREIGEEAGISFTLLILAMLIHSRRQYETAARLLGAAERMMPSYGLKFLSPVEIQGLENTRLALQSALGKKAYQQAWAAGQAMDLEQVQELALSQKVPDKLSPVDLLPAGVGLASRARTNVRSRVLALIEPLSERELEVLGMLAAGATNQEIAQKLFIDIGTVKSHNTHIFAKLGVKNRTQAVERARKLGLL